MSTYAEHLEAEIAKLSEENKRLREYLGYGKVLTFEDVVSYEIGASSWWMERVSYEWARHLAAVYLAFKVNRKMARWRKVFERRGWLERNGYLPADG